jgi:hypothetical protein
LRLGFESVGRSRRLLLSLAVAGLVICGVVGWSVLRHAEDRGGGGSVGIVVVAPDPARALKAVVIGGTVGERRAVRASLSLIGADASSMRVRIADCPKTTLRCARQRISRALTIRPPTSPRGAFPVRSTFLASLVARDAAERLWRLGERVGWQVVPYGQRNVQRRLSRPVSVARLRRAARTIVARAARAGWVLAPVRLYTTAAGAMEVTVRFDDRTLLSNRNSAFGTTLFGRSFRPPIWHTLVMLEGPGGVFEGGGGPGVGASYGADPRRSPPSAAPLPGWLERTPTRLRVEIFAFGHSRPLRFTIECGASTSRPSKATCTRLLRERAVLFSPVQSDNTCLGGATDSSTVQGEVAGIELERAFSNCYGGVTSAWEALLGVHR